MQTQNFGARLGWDHETDTISMMAVPYTVIEDFNSPIWAGATQQQKVTRWRRLVKEHSQNSKSSLDF